MKDGLVIAIDIGGTRIKAGLLDFNGNFVEKISVPTEAYLGKEKVLSNITSVIKNFMKYKVVAIGVAVASPLDPEKGIIYYPPNLPGFEVFNMKAFLEDRFSLPVFIDNDANLYALGEWWKGSGEKANILLCITIGTGIGGGLIFKGNIWHGAHGFGGEFGHITIDPHGPLCNCGNKGCFEAMSSSYFLIKYIKDRLNEGEASILSEFIEDLTPKLIYEAAVKGDTLAIEGFRIIGTNVGIGLASLVNALDPEVVVIGGGLSKAGMILMDPVKAEFNQRVLKGIRDRIQLKLAVLGEFSAVLGAAYLAIKGMGGGE